jgi:hypothetical protein
LERVVIGLVSLAIAAALLFSGRKKKLFFSYYFDKDRHYKRLINAWSVNPKFDLDFDDVSTDVSINSDNDSYLRRKMAERIQACDVFVVVIGKGTHAREWVSYEIGKAREYGKKIVAIKLDKRYVSPKELMSAGARWVYGFKEKDIRAAIES